MEIRICKRYEVPSIAHEIRATHILSLVDPGVTVYTPSSCDGNHRILHMLDVEHTRAEASPKVSQIQEALEWAKTIPDDARMIIHCEAGVSRSTAMAFGVWALKNPGVDLAVGAKWLKRIRPVACPNMLIAEYIDKLLKFNGEFTKICDGIGEWRMLRMIAEMEDHELAEWDKAEREGKAERDGKENWE